MTPAFDISRLTYSAHLTIRRQTNSRSVKLRTGQLADSEFLVLGQLHAQIINMCTLNKNLTLTLTIYRLSKVFSGVIYCKSLLEQLFTVNFKSNVSASWLVRVDQSATWLTASWFVSELSGYPYAIPAWWDFTKSSDRQRIDAVFHRALRADLWSSAATSEPPMFGDLCSTADDELFNKIIQTPIAFYTHCSHHHLLHHNTTLLDGAHIHCSYLDIPLISLTATSYYACCIKTAIDTRYLISSPCVGLHSVNPVNKWKWMNDWKVKAVYSHLGLTE